MNNSVSLCSNRANSFQYGMICHIYLLKWRGNKSVSLFSAEMSGFSTRNVRDPRFHDPAFYKVCFHTSNLEAKLDYIDILHTYIFQLLKEWYVYLLFKILTVNVTLPAFVVIHAEICMDNPGGPNHGVMRN